LNRLEVIHLRLAGQRPEALIAEIRASVIRYDPNMVIRIYQQAAVETDLAIHIQIAEPSANQVDGELGVRLSTALREYGMVAHTVWIEHREETTNT
jgi:DNA-binding FadR family transcriptional regulator